MGNIFFSAGVGDFEDYSSLEFNDTPYHDPRFVEALQVSILNISFLTRPLDGCKVVRDTP